MKATWFTLLFISFLALINFAPSETRLVDIFAPQHVNHPKGY